MSVFRLMQKRNLTASILISYAVNGDNVMTKSTRLVVSSLWGVNVLLFIGLGKCKFNVRMSVALDDKALQRCVGGLGFDTTPGSDCLGVFK